MAKADFFLSSRKVIKVKIVIMSRLYHTVDKIVKNATDVEILSRSTIYQACGTLSRG